MKGDFGETPNPLNSGVSGGAPATNKNPNNKVDAPAAETVSVKTDSLDPTNRPMEKAPVETPEKPKKMKKGYLIAIIVSIVIAIGCGVAAALVLLFSNNDPVSKAIEKIANGQMPSNVAVDGSLSIKGNDGMEAKLNIKGSGIANSKISSLEATLELSSEDEQAVLIKASEISAANGDLYLKIDGISEILDIANNAQKVQYQTNCIGSEDYNCIDYTDCADTDCATEATFGLEMLEMFSGIIDVVDGTWIRISTEELEPIISNTSDEASCSTAFIEDLQNNRNSLKEIYSSNAFISSTTEGVSLPSKHDPVYLVKINEEKFSGFARNLNNFAPIKNYVDCNEDSEAFDADKLISGVKEMPQILVEVDKDYNFTRVYTKTEGEDGETIELDFDISYPENINVSEPTEYVDLMELIQKLFLGFDFDDLDFGFDTDDDYEYDDDDYDYGFDFDDLDW